MTREEILAMETGRELDALLAVKLLGWRWTFSNSLRGGGWWVIRDAEDSATFLPGYTHLEPTDDNERMYTSKLPEYSTTWEGTRLVVEAMRAKGYDFHLNINRYGQPWAEFGIPSEFPLWFEASGDTAPHAVALAAMLAVGGGDAASHD